MPGWEMSRATTCTFLPMNVVLNTVLLITHDSCQTCLPYIFYAMAHACRYHPVGDTDSEAVFCALLNALRAKFTTLPSLPVLHETLGSLCREIVSQDEG